MKTTISTLAVAAALTLVSQAAPLTFDFKDPKGINNAVFKLDAPLESINGTANGITGTITTDPANPADVKGTITVATSSLNVPNPIMQGHMLGEKWLDAAKNPTITFELKSVANIKTTGDTSTGDATGTFTLKGVAKEITVPVRVTYLPGKLKARGGDVDGDLLVIRTNFKLTRSDFKIQAGENAEKVAEEIEISLSIAGAAPKKS